MENVVLKSFIQFIRDLFSLRRLQRIGTRDWVLKFASLMLATVLWYFVGGEDIVDKNIQVPIEIINMPRDLVISNQFKKEIEVTVSGPRSVLKDMENQSVTRQINLSNATPGTNVIENDNKAIRVPRGVTVLRIQPSTVILSLDKLIQKSFKIMPVTTGDVAAGYDLVQMQMNPDNITITGPETVLSHADALLTDIIDVSGMSASRQVQVPLDLDPAIVDLIGETSVTADITIKPRMVQKRISKVAVIGYVGGELREVEPKQVEILANVPVLLMRKNADLQQLFSVTAVGDSADDGELPVIAVPRQDVQLPIQVLSVRPESVTLIKKEDEITDPEGSIEGEEETEEVIEAEKGSASDDSDAAEMLEEEIIEGEENGSYYKKIDGVLHITADRKKILVKE
ncbi:YbbR-like domain-containing protein [Desulfosediminicola sp.]|uniref:CdaR family protein n=1 Tax=Desulfosediminicola sp. TaxID=2886825 RepID=UPI003AF215C5